MESGNSETRPQRLYVEDIELLHWKIRKEQVARCRTVSISEIIHEQLAGVRLEKRAADRERGTT
jgi:hypothetical protein